MTIITDDHCTSYSSPGHPERPERIAKTVEKLRGQTELPIRWGQPARVEDSVLLRAHTAEHLVRLEVPADFDGDTPFLPNIADYARASVGAALEALKSARAGQTAFSLMRPPGHHAIRNRAMGPLRCSRPWPVAPIELQSMISTCITATEPRRFC